MRPCRARSEVRRAEKGNPSDPSYLRRFWERTTTSSFQASGAVSSAVSTKESPHKDHALKAFNAIYQKEEEKEVLRVIILAAENQGKKGRSYFVYKKGMQEWNGTVIHGRSTMTGEKNQLTSRRKEEENEKKNSHRTRGFHTGEPGVLQKNAFWK